MGDIMKALDKAEALICKGLDEIGEKQELSSASLENLGGVLDALKDIGEIRRNYEMTENGYSGHYPSWEIRRHDGNSYRYDRRSRDYGDYDRREPDMRRMERMDPDYR